MAKRIKRLHFTTDKATKDKIIENSIKQNLSFTSYIMQVVMATNVDIKNDKFKKFIDTQQKNSQYYRIKDEKGRFIAFTDEIQREIVGIVKKESFYLRLSESENEEIKRKVKEVSVLFKKDISVSMYLTFAINNYN